MPDSDNNLPMDDGVPTPPPSGDLPAQTLPDNAPEVLHPGTSFVVDFDLAGLSFSDRDARHTG